MKLNSPLSASDRRTYETIFQHPVTHNLEWRLVRSLLGHLAEMTQEPNGNLHFSRNGQSLVLHPEHTKDVAEIEQVMALRHFLKESTVPEVNAAVGTNHWLVVVDHHQTRIFRSEMSGGVPQRISPHEPAYFRHAHHSKDFSRGQEKPDPNSYFSSIAKALEGAAQILVFGNGTGTGSEMEQFIAWIKSNAPELAKRVIGSRSVDEHHLTDGQLLAGAREFYANAKGSQI